MRFSGRTEFVRSVCCFKIYSGVLAFGIFTAISIAPKEQGPAPWGILAGANIPHLGRQNSPESKIPLSTKYVRKVVETRGRPQNVPFDEQKSKNT